MSLAVGDYISILTGGFWEDDEAAAAPDTPTLTGVNDGTGTSATLTVADGAGVTNHIHYAVRGEAFTLGLNRSGNGDVQQTGLSSGWYDFVCVAASGGVYSLPSEVVRLYITTTAAAQTLETAIHYHLTDDVAVAALITARAYLAGEAPQGTDQDYIVYQRISTPREGHQGGSASLANPRVQFTCWSRTPKGAKALADAVRNAFDYATGTIGASGNTVTVKVVYVESEGHQITPPSDASQRAMHGYVLDVVFWQTES